MKRTLSLAAIFLAVLVAGGCSNTGFKDDGISSSDKAAAASANAIAVSVNGDYDKLTDAQKKQFLQLAGGERQARKMVSMMAHPPVQGAGGPSAGGPPTGPHPPGGG